MANQNRHASKEFVNRFGDTAEMTCVIRRAVRPVALPHTETGNPVETWHDVSVVLIPYEEIILPAEY